MRHNLRGQGIQVGLVPLQTLLLHSNHTIPKAVRYSLGKIALAKAAAAHTSAVTAGAALASAAAVKAAWTAAAIILVAGATWLAHQERRQTSAAHPRQPPVALQAPAAALPETARNEFGSATEGTASTEPPEEEPAPAPGPGPSWALPTRPAAASLHPNGASLAALAAGNLTADPTNAAAPPGGLALLAGQVPPRPWLGPSGSQPPSNLPILDGWEPAELYLGTNVHQLLPDLQHPERRATDHGLNQTLLLGPSLAVGYVPPVAPAPMPSPPARPGGPARPRGF
jgi:hypothetical protein